MIDRDGSLMAHYGETNEGKQELNMLYVAATRAVRTLDLSVSVSLREIIGTAHHRRQQRLAASVDDEVTAVTA